MRKYCIAATLILTALAGMERLTERYAEAQSGTRVQPGSGTRVQSGTRIQSGRRSQGPGGGTRTAVKPPFEERFWDYLQRANYRNWAPASGQNGGFYEGQSPHGDYLKMYLNRTAFANPTDPPHNAILIKENYSADQRTLMAITVMFRSKGFDVEHNDWYWVKYNPDGSVARAANGGTKLAGKVNGCIQCHSGAGGNDFLFINDQ